MTDIIWDKDSRIMVVAADRTLGSLLKRLDEEVVDWVVVVRTEFDGPEVYYYAFRISEVRELAEAFPERRTQSLERAMFMHEPRSSSTTRGGRPFGPKIEFKSGPAAERIVDFDAGGRIVAIGYPGTPLEDLGPMRGEAMRGEELRGETMRGSETFSRSLSFGVELGGEEHARPRHTSRAAPPAEIDVTLSAETKSEVQVGSIEKVEFLLELTSEALPLAVSERASAKSDVPIVVSLSVEKNDVLEVVGNTTFTYDPPAPGQPRSGFFRVKGVRTDTVRLAVAFRQGGSDLGVISLAVAVVADTAKALPAQGSSIAAPRDPADDDMLTLLIHQRSEGGRVIEERSQDGQVIGQRLEGGEVYYEYTLYSEALGLPWQEMRSKPLKDRGDGPAASTPAFVERIYERVTQRLSKVDLQREARALGVSLCQELFDPEVARVLWPLRSRIKLVRIKSWEPYIPWELVRLQDPDSQDIDERFLAEYSLIRTLTDKDPARTLPLAEWVYLGATFQYVPYKPIGEELDYFTGTTPESLQGQGITPSALAATRDAFYDLLGKGDFDVLHIACHAESPQDSIDRARLIIGDEIPPGTDKAQVVEVDTVTVQAEARLNKRRPLVFLNGCETGREGAVLTAWGGWPNVFLRAGAGAFVGSSWPVRDKPAAVFSIAFYNALLDGKTLAEAAAAGRTAAKEFGDASWLAFKVYGHPRARRAA